MRCCRLTLSAIAITSLLSLRPTPPFDPPGGFTGPANVAQAAPIGAQQPLAAHADLQPTPALRKGVCACYAPGTDPDYAQAFEAYLCTNNPHAFTASTRWSNTATQGSTGSAGSPITLTYSFVPDGVLSVADGAVGPGITSVNNVLHQVLNSKFGASQVWKDLFRDMFAEWSAETGITFIEQPTDDRAIWPISAGSLGVRGDIRVICIDIDGPNGVLAFNYFPNFGDMALDQDENWSAGSPGFAMLRNTLTHELGHGIGLDHAGPQDGSKLMEAFLNLGFIGPQDDDLRGGQWYYGDAAEPNDSSAAAASLGAFSDQKSFETLALSSHLDADWFAVSAPPGTSAAFRVSPLGGNYLVGADPGTPSPIDTRAVNALRVEVFNQAGTTLLRTATASALGANATTAAVAVPGGSSGLRIRVSTPGTNNAVQRYALTMLAGASAMRTITIDGPALAGLAIAASPADVAGNSSAGVGSQLTYESGATVTLTAPQSIAGAPFVRWIIDNVEQPLDKRTATLSMTANHTARVVYAVGLVVDAGTDRDFVPGEAVTLHAAAYGGHPPFTYAWSPAQAVSNSTSATVQAQPVQTTTYAVTVRDSHGDEATDTVTLRQVAALQANAGEDRLAAADQFFALEGSATGGSPPYSYAWSPASAFTDPTAAASYAKVTEETKLTLTVTDAQGRTAIDDVQVTMAPELLVHAGEDRTILRGESIELDADVTGGVEPYTFAWSQTNSGETASVGEPTGDTLVVEPQNTTVYSVVATDAIGQQASDEMRVTVLAPLQVSARSTPGSIEAGETTVLEAIAAGGLPPYQYAWSPGDSLQSTSGIFVTASPGQTTTYTVNVSDSAGYTAAATVTVQVSEDRVAGATAVAPCGFGAGLSLAVVSLACGPLRRRWV